MFVGVVMLVNNVGKVIVGASCDDILAVFYTACIMTIDILSLINILLK